MIDVDTERLLTEAREKIRQGIEPTEDEMREIILAARAGRRAAAEGQRAKRAKPVELTVHSLFNR